MVRCRDIVLHRAVVSGTVAPFPGHLQLFDIEAVYGDAQSMSGSDFKREVIERSDVV